MRLPGVLGGLPDRISRRRGVPEEGASPPEMDETLQSIARLMGSEKLQNKNIDPGFRKAVVRGLDVDSLPGAAGEFGRDLGNPIPANATIGEMLYLSRLAAEDTDQRLMFHLLGGVMGPHCSVDIFETVTLDGKKWDVLCFSMFHPRKSRRTPDGYRFVDPSPPHFLFGVNRTVLNFPENMQQVVAKWTENVFGVPLPPPQIVQAEKTVRFKRPPEHLERIKALVDAGRENHRDNPLELVPPSMPAPRPKAKARPKRRQKERVMRRKHKKKKRRK